MGTETVEAGAYAVLPEHGRIDVLHNNVGITVMGRPIAFTERRWDIVLDVNPESACLTYRHVRPTMPKQGTGAIINISSMAAIRYSGYSYAAY